MICGVCEKKALIKERVIYYWRYSGTPVAVHEACEWAVIKDTRVVKPQKRRAS
jgi:hypothetical protein